jgi:hypothetical protein
MDTCYNKIYKHFYAIAIVYCETMILFQTFAEPSTKVSEKAIRKAREIFDYAKINASQESINIIAKCLQKYEKNSKVAKEIADCLKEIGYYTGSEKALSETALCISKFEASVAKEIADCLKWVAYSTSTYHLKVVECEEKVINVASEISQFEKNPEEAKKIAEKYRDQARIASSLTFR